MAEMDSSHLDTTTSFPSPSPPSLNVALADSIAPFTWLLLCYALARNGFGRHSSLLLTCRQHSGVRSSTSQAPSRKALTQRLAVFPNNKFDLEFEHDRQTTST
jgi:hypothetical protein